MFDGVLDAAHMILGTIKKQRPLFTRHQLDVARFLPYVLEIRTRSYRSLKMTWIVASTLSQRQTGTRSEGAAAASLHAPCIVTGVSRCYCVTWLSTRNTGFEATYYRSTGAPAGILFSWEERREKKALKKKKAPGKQNGPSPSASPKSTGVHT